MQTVEQFFDLDQGIKTGHYIGKDDVRCYQPPAGYHATAHLIDIHPVTGEPFAQSQWWIFLTPD